MSVRIRLNLGMIIHTMLKFEVAFIKIGRIFSFAAN